MNNKFRELSDKAYPHVSDKAKQALDNINACFDEADRRVESMQRLADFVAGRPPNGMAHEYLGIFHGGEFVMSPNNHKSRRDLLDRRCKGMNRSVVGDVVVTINMPK